MSNNAVPQGNEAFRARMKEVAQQLRKPQGEFGIKIAENMNHTNKEMYDLMFESLVITEQANVLEIGFGNGFFFPKYIDKNPSATLFGVDFSEEMCLLAAEKNKQLVEEKKLTLFCEDAQSLPFEDNFLDVITTLNTIYFWKNTQEYFQELYRVLKPNGSVYICFRPKKVMEAYEFTQEGFEFFEIEQVIKQAEKAKLKYKNYTSKAYPKQNITGAYINSLDICLILNK